MKLSGGDGEIGTQSLACSTARGHRCAGAAPDVRREVDMANESCRADLAVVTGDFITGASTAGRLHRGNSVIFRAPGVFGCNGKSEFMPVPKCAARASRASWHKLLRHEM